MNSDRGLIQLHVTSMAAPSTTSVLKALAETQGVTSNVTSTNHTAHSECSQVLPWHTASTSNSWSLIQKHIYFIKATQVYCHCRKLPNQCNNKRNTWWSCTPSPYLPLFMCTSPFVSPLWRAPQVPQNCFVRERPGALNLVTSSNFCKTEDRVQFFPLASW